MPFDYQTPDGEKFLSKLEAKDHVADEKDLRFKDAEDLIEKITKEETDEEMLDVYLWRMEQFWEAVRQVKVKASHEDVAKERAEQKIMEIATEITHKVHEDFEKIKKVDEAPRSELESGEYWEDDKE